MSYKVSVITPTRQRTEMLEKCIAQFNAQDYPNKEMIIAFNDRETYDYLGSLEYKPTDNVFPLDVVKENPTIGYLRNEACKFAKGEIILHMDDDDFYATDWITQSVESLISSGGDIVGLINAYFYRHPDKLWLYKPTRTMIPVILGATMCYWKKTWERGHFPNISKGEDTSFYNKVAQKPFAHDYKDGFVAMIHGRNTHSHNSLWFMQELNPKSLKELLKDNYERFERSL